MTITLDIEKMTATEKLALMERLWEDLSKNPEDVVSPAWHGKEIARRRALAAKGEVGFSEIDEVKKRLRKVCR